LTERKKLLSIQYPGGSATVEILVYHVNPMLIRSRSKNVGRTIVVGRLNVER